MTRHTGTWTPPASSPITHNYRLQPRAAPSLVWPAPKGTRARNQPSSAAISSSLDIFERPGTSSA